ncbi:CPBP family intramembrane glutamic endopeptidase [Leptolyngbya ohadii]|uniref:CPBP family intramembrane glutamic endopeptidase n=1 Tax=Leptolyngbya ohadii TaxID=1962290 RepID=UPI000B59DE9F|nr:CPBP family intramembrane glutamic endopeptidase [Leptolyngbya ohadii]
MPLTLLLNGLLNQLVNSQPISSQSIWLNAPAILRALAFFVVWLVCWLPIAFPIAKAVKWQFPQPVSPPQKLPLLASLYALAPLVLWGMVALEGASFADYGLPWNGSILRSFVIGLGLGSLGLVSLFLLEWGLGWIAWKFPDAPHRTANTTEPIGIETEITAQSRAQILPTLFTTLLIGTWIALTEELIFRGFLLNTLEQDFLPWIAATIASLIFAVLHLVWEGKENIPQLPGLFLMGMVLVLARWADQGNLGLAWGLHAGWIWVMASLDTLGVIHYRDRISPWVTGLDSKPLAGMMGLLFLLVTGGVISGIFGIAF